jgi:hypothetical protein
VIHDLLFQGAMTVERTVNEDKDSVQGADGSEQVATVCHFKWEDMSNRVICWSYKYRPV